MLSGLQHWCFCKRQCGLIHLDQQWSENRLTLEGQDLHETVVEGKSEKRPGIRIERNLSLKSNRLGLIGKTDVVEFHRQEASVKSPPTPHQGGTSIGGDELPASGKWLPFPVEYKRGKPKAGLEDQVQLCAQAICLEEMYDCAIPAGALFYGTSRRRLDVPFSPELRAETTAAAEGFHRMMSSGELPPPEFGPKCRNCSLHDVCLPETGTVSLTQYFERL